jgi:hypothetical protein
VDIEAIADQVVADIAQNPAFGGLDEDDLYGTVVPGGYVASPENTNRIQEAKRVAAVRQGVIAKSALLQGLDDPDRVASIFSEGPTDAQRRQAARQRVIDKSYLLQGLENPDLADTLFPAGDRIDRGSMVAVGPSYGRTDVRMDRIVSLAPQEAGAYPRVTRADLFGNDGGEPEVDAYGFACPVPTRRKERVGALDIVAGVTEPSAVPAEFFGATERRDRRDRQGLGYGTMGLPSTGPHAENLRYGVMGLPSTAPRPENVTRYGDDSRAPGTFSDSLLTGLGLGLGIATAFVGVSVLARALR